jgi:MYXO-CTERM domain-containing protein
MRLFVVDNTFVNDFGKGTFINVSNGGTLTAHNNLMIGMGTPSSTGALSADNLSGEATSDLVAAATYDYHLVVGSPPIGKAVAPGSADTFSLVPSEEYVHPLGHVARAADADVGAYEFGTPQGGTGGAASSTSGSNGTGAGAGTTGAGGHTGAGGSDEGAGGGASSGTPGSKSGCGCVVAGEPAGTPLALLASVLGLAAMVRRRRAR